MNSTTETSAPTTTTNSKKTHEDAAKFLIFLVGEELFGVPLMGVREVVEPQKVKKIPNTVDYFMGVINIRGEIVGVIDLRLRFNQQAKDNPYMAMIIFESAVGPIGAIVDKVESVTELEKADIDDAPNIAADVPMDYLVGIGKIKNSLVTLINLNEVLGSETLTKLRRMSK